MRRILQDVGPPNKGWWNTKFQKLTAAQTEKSVKIDCGGAEDYFVFRIPGLMTDSFNKLFTLLRIRHKIDPKLGTYSQNTNLVWEGLHAAANWHYFFPFKIPTIDKFWKISSCEINPLSKTDIMPSAKMCFEQKHVNCRIRNELFATFEYFAACRKRWSKCLAQC